VVKFASLGIFVFRQLAVSAVLVLSVGSCPATAQTGSNPQREFSELSAQAAAARDSNRLQDALVLYRKALTRKPAWAEGWWSLGTISYDQNSYAEAARAFQKVIALAPSDGTAYVMLGLCEFELGYNDAALKHIERGENLGLDQDPDLRHVALYHQGVLLQRKEKFQAAREILEQLCLQGAEGDDISIALGMTMLRQASKTPPAAGSTDAGVVTKIGQAECLTAQKKFDEARSRFDAVLAGYSKYPEIHYAYGLALVEASALPAAIAQFRQEIENNPSDVISRLQIAAADYKIDSAAGLPYAEQAVKLAPKQPFAHLVLGLLLLDVDNFQRAIPELEIARKGFPSDARVYLALGTAYSRAGRRADAARARATAQRLSEHMQPENGLGSAQGTPDLPLSPPLRAPQ